MLALFMCSYLQYVMPAAVVEVVKCICYAHTSNLRKPPTLDHLVHTIPGDTWFSCTVYAVSTVCLEGGALFMH